jgi:hypothetical protein
MSKEESRYLWSNLKRLNKGPEENSDGVALSEQLDQSGGAKKSQKTDVDEVFLKSQQN